MDDSDAEFNEPMEPSPDDEGEIATPHSYDAVFFIVAALVAVGFVVVLFYFRG